MAVYSRIKIWSAGEVLTAADLNAEFENIRTNSVPTALEDYSSTVAEMQTVVDPGGLGSESLATSLAGELARLRYMIKLITGGVQWYASALTGWITTNMIGALQITTALINDLAVTTGKIADLAVTEAKLANGSITASKLAPATKASAVLTATWTQPTSGATTYTLNSISRAANIVTAVLSAPPTISVGQLIIIGSVTTASFNADGLMCIGKNGSTVYLYQPGADEVGVVGSGTFGAYAAWVPADSASAIGSITRASNIVTVTFSGPTVFQRVGQKVAIYLTAGAATKFDGLHTITEVVSSTSFRYAQTGPNESGTVATGSFVPLAGVSLTNVTGRSVSVQTVDGTLYESAVGAALASNLLIAKPVSGNFGFFIANNISNQAFAVNESTAITKSPLTPFVAASSGGPVTSALTITPTQTNIMQLPLAINAVDYEPTAGAHDYFLVHYVSSGYATLTATISSLKMLAYEF